jgi:tRNA-specific 2-thiouridylase
VVGPHASLGCTQVQARGRLHVPVERAEVKLRYRSPAAPARIDASKGGFRLELDSPAYGVARGQTAVLYEGDVVVGSGVISSAGPAA